METLPQLRERIDTIDTQILSLLAERFQTVEKVAHYKKEHHLPALQKNRWEEVLQKRKTTALSLGIDPDWVGDVWELIHVYALKKEEEILNIPKEL